MRQITFILALLFSVSATAQSSRDLYRLFPVLECPAVGDEFEQMISKLESIKAAIRTDANCSNVTLQVQSLQDLVVKDREVVMAIVNNEEQQALTEDQATTVREYAENVTKKVAALNDLFMRSNQCFAEDQTDQQLSTLAGFVNEAAQLVGSLTGPWGAPIALAGNVVAGFLTGLDEVLNKSRAGYDFSKREQWLSYVENLCTYYSYREQIDHLLNPKAKISQLKALRFELNSQIRVMTEACVECKKIESVFRAQNHASPDSLKTMLTSELDAADQRFKKPYGTYTLQSLGLRDWVNREIERIEREAQSYWSDVSGRYILGLAKKDIEDMLIEREAPKFLAYQTWHARGEYRNFQNFLSEDGRDIYNQLEGVNSSIIPKKVAARGWSVNPLEYFRALVLQPLNFALLPATDEAEDLKYSWTYVRDESLAKWRLAQTSTEVAQSFCSFFKHSGKYSAAIRAHCADPQFDELNKSQNQIAQELQSANVSWVGSAPRITPIVDGIEYSQSKLEALSKAIQTRDLGQ